MPSQGREQQAASLQRKVGIGSKLLERDLRYSLIILVGKSRGHRAYRPGLQRAKFLEERGRDWEEIQHHERVIPSLAT